MPPKGQKKGKDDSTNVATSTQDSLETDIDDTDLKPFERLMLAKLSKLGENMKELSNNVSKLTNHVLKKVDNTEIIEVMKDTSNKSVAAIKELKDTMKDLTKENQAPSHFQSQALQEESTQILLEQESQKIKQSIIDKWNTNLTKRRTEYWQMLRNKNTSETYNTWKNTVPMILPRKFQMKTIEGEPITQTQRREKQVVYNYQTDIELLELRAGSHEEKCQTIDKTMEELICQKATGQRREMIAQLWKDDCEREERISLERWENTTLKWFKKYEEDFLKFFQSKNPLIRDDKFRPPKVREEKQTSERQPNLSEIGDDDDVIVTGTSYADATRKNTVDARDNTNTTFIGKNVRFSNNNNTRNKRSNPKPETHFFPGQGSQNQAANLNRPKPNYPYINTRRPGQQGYSSNGPRPGLSNRRPNNYPQNAGRNTTQDPDLRSNNFLYRGNWQHNKR